VVDEGLGTEIYYGMNTFGKEKGPKRLPKSLYLFGGDERDRTVDLCVANGKIYHFKLFHLLPPV
jgi:hypothetical protein